MNWIAGLVVLLLSLFVGACTWFWRRDLILCGELLAVTSESGNRLLPLKVDTSFQELTGRSVRCSNAAT